MELSFNDLPQAVSRLYDKLENIEALLNKKSDTKTVSTDQWFDLTELCAYLPDKPAKPTVYAWVNQRLIPYHKGGKKLRFLKSDIDAWLKAGRQMTLSEISKSNDQFLRTSKRRSGGKRQ